MSLKHPSAYGLILVTLLALPSAFAQSTGDSMGGSSADDSAPADSEAWTRHRHEATVRDVSQSERYHQAYAQTFELTPSIFLVAANTKFRDSDTELDSAGVPLSVSGEYGITSFFAMALNLGVATYAASYSDCPNGTVCDTATSSGMNDPSVDFKFKIPVGFGIFRLGANASVSVEKSVIKSSGDSNTASGGSKVTPFLAYEFPVGPGILGAQVQYDAYKGDRRQDDKGTSETLKGGAAFSTTVFYELNHGIMTYGGALLYGTSGRTKSVEDGITTENSDAFYTFAVQAYFPVHFRNAITLLPAVSYVWLNYPSGSSINTTGAFQIGTAARFTF